MSASSARVVLVERRPLGGRSGSRLPGRPGLLRFELRNRVAKEREAAPLALYLLIEAGLVELHSLFVEAGALQKVVHGAEERGALRFERERASIERERTVVFTEIR